MNENDSKNCIDIENHVNDSAIENHINDDTTQSHGDDLNISENKPLVNKHNIHQHNSKCFITEVFMHGISFILHKSVHNSSPNFFNIKSFNSNSVSSADDGYGDDNTLSTEGSITSEQRQIISRGISSEGYQEIEIPIKTESHLEKAMNLLSANLRISICDSCDNLPKFSKSFYNSLEHVLVYFEDKYHSCQWLNSNASQLNEKEIIEAREELFKVYESMFIDKINWGRIIAMIGFVGELAVCALSADRFQFIEEYVATSVSYMHENLMGWIVEHGGWEGLVDFQMGQGNVGGDLDNMFGNLGRLAGVAALALAGVAICKFVSDHI